MVHLGPQQHPRSDSHVLQCSCMCPGWLPWPHTPHGGGGKGLSAHPRGSAQLQTEDTENPHNLLSVPHLSEPNGQAWKRAADVGGGGSASHTQASAGDESLLPSRSQAAWPALQPCSYSHSRATGTATTLRLKKTHVSGGWATVFNSSWNRKVLKAFPPTIRYPFGL